MSATMTPLDAVATILHTVAELRPVIHPAPDGWECLCTESGRWRVVFAPDLPYLALTLLGFAQKAGLVIDEDMTRAARVLEALRAEEEGAG